MHYVVCTVVAAVEVVAVCLLGNAVGLNNYASFAKFTVSARFDGPDNGPELARFLPPSGS